MKKFKLVTLVAVTAVLIGAGIFYGCKKDPMYPMDTMDVKMKKSADESRLHGFEDYTPNESTVNEKLIRFTDYVNKPDEFPMPNMELKEAVWFAETFFNLGICQKQEYSVQYVIDEKTYSITIPFEGELDSEIFLNGEVFQAEYRNLLSTVVSKLCGEYALNFGDVYVTSINKEDRKITIGLDVLYGHKTNTSRVFRFLSMIGPNFSPVLYPNDGPACPISFYPIVGFGGGISVAPDEGLSALLNQERNKIFPFNIQAKTIRANVSPENDNIYHTIHAEVTTVYLMESDYNDYGESYKDIIYNKRQLDKQVPTGYSPFWAYAMFLSFTEYSPYSWHVIQEFGIEKICKYDAPLYRLISYDYIKFDKCLAVMM